MINTTLNHNNYLFLFFMLFQSVCLLSLPSICYSETVEIIADGSYTMGEGESSTVARQRAKLQAIKNAIQQGGSYLENYLKTKNYRLNTDQIRVMTSSIMKISDKFADNKLNITKNGFSFHARIIAILSTGVVDNMVEKFENNRIVEHYKNIQGYYDRIAKNIDGLKEMISQTQEANYKKAITRKIADQEKLFQTNMLFDEGFRYSLENEYDKAIDAFTKGENLSPNYFKYYRGITGNDFGRYDPAIYDYNLAIEINQIIAEVYNNRGYTWFNKGKYDRAVSDYTMAIGKTSQNDSYYINRGLAHYYQGWYLKAISDFNKALDIKPKNALAYLKRGDAYRSNGQYDQAIFDYYRAIEINPQLTDAYNSRGFAYVDKGLFDRAMDDYNKAIQIDPQAAGTYNNRGTVYAAKGKYDMAISDYSRAIELNPMFAEAYLNKALASESVGRKSEAVGSYRRYIQYAPPKDARDIEYAKKKIKELSGIKGTGQ